MYTSVEKNFLSAPDILTWTRDLITSAGKTANQNDTPPHPPQNTVLTAPKTFGMGNIQVPDNANAYDLYKMFHKVLFNVLDIHYRRLACFMKILLLKRIFEKR